MNIFCMRNDIPMGRCAHFPLHSYINWPNQDLQYSIFWKLSVEKSSPATLCFYGLFFLTLVLSSRITQKNRHGYKLICLEWASLRMDWLMDHLTERPTWLMDHLTERPTWFMDHLTERPTWLVDHLTERPTWLVDHLTERPIWLMDHF